MFIQIIVWGLTSGKLNKVENSVPGRGKNESVLGWFQENQVT